MLGKVEITETGMFATVQLFGKTKRTRISETQNVGADLVFDAVVYVERPEDWYSLSSPELRNKRLIVIKREDWVDFDNHIDPSWF